MASAVASFEVELEAQIRREAKRQLRADNLKASEKRQDESALKNLDANIKKNTAFIKKLREITDKQRESMVKELAGLKIGKYLSEAVTAITEAKLKQSSDIDAAVHICSIFHQRYAEFGPMLVSTLQRLLVVPKTEKEEEQVARLARQRPALRLLTELLLVAVFTEHTIVYNILKDLFIHDKDVVSNITLAVTFSKSVSIDLFGIVPRNSRINDDSNKSLNALTKEQQNAFLSLMRSYFNAIASKLVDEHKTVRRLEREIHHQESTRGEVSAEIKANYEKTLKAYEKLGSSVQSLGEYVDLPLPDLPEEATTTRIAASGIVLVATTTNEDNFKEGAIFEDDDTRSFYESLIDLKALIPPMLLGLDTTTKAGKDTKEKKSEEKTKSEGTAGKETDELTAAATEPAETTPTKDTSSSSNSEQPSDSASKVNEDKDDAPKPGSNAAAVEALLTNTLSIGNRDLMDKAALDFCYLNSKNSRKRLIKVFANVQKTRLDYLPYYARFIATLNSCMPEIGSSLVTLLEEDFQSTFNKKDASALEQRIKNIRFLGELTKFQVCSTNIILNILKMLLDDFSTSSVELACTLLETAGRFLFRLPTTHVRMVNLLEILMRKKIALHLDNRQSMMVENAYFQCNPPDKTARIVKERPVLHEYVRHLLYVELTQNSVEKVLKQFRKLPWHQPEMRNYLLRRFVKVWKYKYSSIDLIACVVAGLMRYHDNFAVAIVDCILEEIRVGLEENDYRHNQKRVAVVKYLGELYNYRVVESSVIFDTIHTLISFGHEGGRAQLGKVAPLDLPDDFFRIRLICTLLDTCGSYFDRGVLKVKLDVFLMYFQRYVLTKQDLPLDVEFMLSDTLEFLRPKLVFVKDYALACQQIDTIEQEMLQQLQADIKMGDGKVADEDDDDEEDNARQEAANSESSDESEKADDTDFEEEDEEMETSDDQFNEKEEDVVVHAPVAPQKQADDDEFEAELNRIMAESIEQRKKETNRNVELTVPMSMFGGGSDKRGPERDADGNIVFTLLTKKGHKQQAKVIAVPALSTLGKHSLASTEVNQKELSALKRMVLQRAEDEVDTTFTSPRPALAPSVSAETPGKNTRTPYDNRQANGSGGGSRVGRGGIRYTGQTSNRRR